MIIILQMNKGAQHLNITCIQSWDKMGMNSDLNPHIQIPDTGHLAIYLLPTQSVILPARSLWRFPVALSGE